MVARRTSSKKSNTRRNILIGGSLIGGAIAGRKIYKYRRAISASARKLVGMKPFKGKKPTKVTKKALYAVTRGKSAKLTKSRIGNGKRMRKIMSVTEGGVPRRTLGGFVNKLKRRSRITLTPSGQKWIKRTAANPGKYFSGKIKNAGKRAVRRVRRGRY